MYLGDVALVGLLALAGSAESKTVRTRSGVVQGSKCVATDVDYFLSVPYAKPPVGDLRFAPPEPLNNTAYTVINATIPPPACPQFTVFFGELGIQNENCLFLNIWAPVSATSKSNLPVKVWLYGGSNEGGGVSNPLYNGCFSAVDSIVVSVNYRLGPLGFLALSDLGLTGNYGLMDQLLALRWVQENVRGFGGDPRKVLLFGESAGATDAFILSTLPEAPELIRAAALESGAGRDLATVADAQTWYSQFVTALNCSTPNVACLRAASPAGLQTAASTLPASDVVSVNSPLNFNGTRSAWTPLIDGKLLTEQPSTAGLKVPSIIGSNANEGSLFVLATYGEAALQQQLNQSSYDEFLTVNFGPLAARVNETYSVTSAFNGSVVDAMEVIVTDVSYKCPSYRALLQAEKNGIPVWSYQFAHSPSCTWHRLIAAAWLPALKATHTSEIPFVFNFTRAMPPPNGNCTFTQPEQNLSRTISRAWTNMAETGSPGDQNTWPTWKSDERMGVVFNDAVEIARVNYTSCAFWDEINEELNEYWAKQ
ncbi:hypothetical protein AAE478_003303 [Parahypoxylon ruwenzoriense]